MQQQKRWATAAMTHVNDRFTYVNLLECKTFEHTC